MLIEKLPAKPVQVKRVKVAAYIRVSADNQRLEHSFQAQSRHYQQLIQNNPAWQFAGIYSDYGVSGTSMKHRTGFTCLLDAARRGEIDVILTKSISRFARNTVDLLDTIRALKTRGVAVRFERENIDTSSSDGELLLTLLASFAQEESRSLSQNVKWSIRRRFAQGIPNVRIPYGYSWNGTGLTVNQAEASIVQQVFDNYLSGLSPEQTVKQLNAMGLTTRNGKPFHPSTARKFLENPTYRGDLICQDTYKPRIGACSKRIKNRGELAKYIIEQAHEAIIDPETFDEVQTELKRRREVGRARTPSGGSSALTSKIVCEACGRCFHRRTRKRRTLSYKFWWCWTATQGKGNPCHAPQIKETLIKDLCMKTLGINQWDGETIITSITAITISSDRTITIKMRDGSKHVFNSEAHHA